MGKRKTRGTKGAKQHNRHTHSIFTQVDREVLRKEVCHKAQNKASQELATLEKEANSRGGLIPERVAATSSTTAEAAVSELDHKDKGRSTAQTFQ